MLYIFHFYIFVLCFIFSFLFKRSLQPDNIHRLPWLPCHSVQNIYLAPHVSWRHLLPWLACPIDRPLLLDWLYFPTICTESSSNWDQDWLYLPTICTKSTKWNTTSWFQNCTNQWLLRLVDQEGINFCYQHQLWLQLLRILWISSNKRWSNNAK